MCEIIPSWANDILILKGIGFERKDVKEVVWGFFFENHYDAGRSQVENENQFAAVVDSLIKSGHIDMAIQHMKALENQPKAKPIRRSQLAQFEEKAKRWLARFDE